MAGKALARIGTPEGAVNLFAAPFIIVVDQLRADFDLFERDLSHSPRPIRFLK